MSYAKQLLSECFAAGGMSIEAACQAAELVLSTCVAAGIVSEVRLESWETEAKIHDLRGKRVTAVNVATRLGVDRATVFRAVKNHQRRRRAALKVAV